MADSGYPVAGQVIDTLDKTDGSNFGLVKLSDTYDSSVGAAADGIGASQKALNDEHEFMKHYNYTRSTHPDDSMGVGGWYTGTPYYPIMFFMSGQGFNFPNNPPKRGSMSHYPDIMYDFQGESIEVVVPGTATSVNNCQLWVNALPFKDSLTSDQLQTFQDTLLRTNEWTYTLEIRGGLKTYKNTSWTISNVVSNANWLFMADLTPIATVPSFSANRAIVISFSMQHRKT